MLHRRVYCLTQKLSLASIDGLVVRHTCDNPACIEPTHLLLGTKGDNNRDRASRGRSADRRGEAHPLAILDANQIREIRQLHAAKKFNQPELARRFGCTQSHISRVINRNVWSHI